MRSAGETVLHGPSARAHAENSGLHLCLDLPVVASLNPYAGVSCWIGGAAAEMPRVRNLGI